MSKTVLTKVSGFTPVIDTLIEQHGAITALVFGKVWRYCQMSDNVCTASQQRIANELGITRKTVNLSIDVLVTNGYLRDLTPGLLGSPHKYQDTGKAILKSSIAAVVTDSYTPPTEPVTVGYTPCNLELHPPVTVGYSKIDSKIQEDTNTAPAEADAERKKRTPRPPTQQELAQQELVDHFQQVTKINLPTAKSSADYKANQTRWWKPIKQILEQTNYDMQQAEFCIDRAIQDMRKNRLTISAPQSILNNALSVYQSQEAL